MVGKNYNVIQYDVNPETYLIDYDEVEKLALEHQPRLIICGASAYPRQIDFKRFREIVDKVNEKIAEDIEKTGGDDRYKSELWDENRCILMADVAHIAGLIVTGLHPSPFPYCDVVTTTTHKTLRCIRGAIILTNDENIAKKINKSVFPATQGGGLQNIIAAKAVGFYEALQPEFKEYMEQVVKNAKVLAEALKQDGFDVLTGGTDNHLILLDLRNKGITGKELETRLANCHIITNKNAVPFDTEKKTITSGLRLGTPAITSRGLKEDDMREIASLINLCANPYYETNIEAIKAHVQALCKKYPLYPKELPQYIVTPYEYDRTGSVVIEGDDK